MGNWSGSTEFLSSATSLPLKIDGLVDVPEGNAPKGHRWAQPSVKHLRELMRWSMGHRDEASALGAKARAEMVAKYSPLAITRRYIVPRLKDLQVHLRGRDQM